jgi:hypothetical protein
MADISTNDPIAIRRLSLPRLRFPRLELGASLSEIFGLWNDAINMAYVAPYASIRRQPQTVSDDDLDGRDASW